MQEVSRNGTPTEASEEPLAVDRETTTLDDLLSAKDGVMEGWGGWSANGESRVCLT